MQKMNTEVANASYKQRYMNLSTFSKQEINLNQARQKVRPQNVGKQLRNIR